MSTPSQPAPELPCVFCGRPKSDPLHRADEKLLACSSWAKDDYHDFAESPYKPEPVAGLEEAARELAKWKGRAKKFQNGYRDAQAEATALLFQKLQLEAEGADVVLPRQNASLRRKILELARERNELREQARQRERLVWLEAAGIAKQVHCAWMGCGTKIAKLLRAKAEGAEGEK